MAVPGVVEPGVVVVVPLLEPPPWPGTPDPPPLGPLPGVEPCVPGESPVPDGPRGTVVVVECSLTVVVPGDAGVFVPEVELVVVVPAW